MLRQWCLAALMVVVVSIGSVGIVHAELVVCGDGNGLVRYFRTDISNAVSGNCSFVSKGNTSSQVSLIQSVGRLDYLKVVGGLVVEKSQAEKDVVNSSNAAIAANNAALLTEINTDNLCNADSLSDINSKLAVAKGNVQAAIDAVSNVATAKAALQQLTDTQFVIDQRVIRCMWALRKVKQ